MMDRQVFSISEADAHVLADRFFIEAGRFNLEKEKHVRMIDAARTVLEKGLSGIQIRGCFAAFSAEVYHENVIAIGEEILKAEAFGRIHPDTVKWVVPYIVTSGDCLVEDENNIIDQLYAYMWGTAYVDAGRIMMEEMIKNQFIGDDEDVVLSPPIGPGFYGMDNRQSGNINRILGGDELGIKVVDSGVMLPIKSCSGLYLVTNKDADFPTEACIVCEANRDGCNHCMIRIREKEHIQQS
jgi:hypothetical protein